MPPFGVSEFTTWPWSFAEDVKNYSALGADTIEVCEFKLDRDLWQWQLETIPQMGLTVSSVQPILHSLFPDQPRPGPADPRLRMELFRGSIERFAPVAPGATLVTICGAAPEGNYRLAFETAVREYRALAEFAGEHGVRVALEPLNPILMNVDTFVCTIADAMEIVRAVDHPSFGIFIDVWHVWPDAEAARNIVACGDRIFGVHVNDWHRPRHYGDRATIGQGCIDLPPLLRAIHESGYRGAYTLEIFSVDRLPDSLWKGDLKKLVRRNKAAFERVWREAMCN